MKVIKHIYHFSGLDETWISLVVLGHIVYTYKHLTLT
jgi:hypothetical protein